MAWTSPATAGSLDTLTAAYWNAQVRDNISYLKTLPQHLRVVDLDSQYTISATSLTAIDTTNLRLNMPATVSGLIEVWVGFTCSAGSANNSLMLDIRVGGTTMYFNNLTGGYWVTRRLAAAADYEYVFARGIISVTPGTAYALDLAAMRDAGNVHIQACYTSGTAYQKTPIIFGAREW